MIKSLVPPEQTFRELASEQFFLIADQRNLLFQKILPVGIFNAIRLTENESNHGHSHSYNLRLVQIDDNQNVRHISLVKVDISIMPNLDL